MHNSNVKPIRYINCYSDSSIVGLKGGDNGLLEVRTHTLSRDPRETIEIFDLVNGRPVETMECLEYIRYPRKEALELDNIYILTNKELDIVECRATCDHRVIRTISNPKPNPDRIFGADLCLCGEYLAILAGRKSNKVVNGYSEIVCIYKMKDII